MSLFWGPDNDDRPVQWKTREPVRPRIKGGRPSGFAFSPRPRRGGRVVPLADILAALALFGVAAMLWAIGAMLEP